jgi:xanthine dehydrogenase accessory factor
MVSKVLQHTIAEVRAGRPVALCAIVATRGSTPQPAGTIVCVDQAGQMTGTLGGGCMEADVRRRAHQCLADGTGRVVTFALDHDFGYDDGMLCGGEVDVAIAVQTHGHNVSDIILALEKVRCGGPAEIPLRVALENGRGEYRIRVEAAPRLLIAGGGHVGRILAQMMVPLGFAVTVIDDRRQFANPERFPAPIEPVTGDISETLRHWPIDGNTYAVIVTRGHKHDEAALLAVVNSPARYIGMIGSHRKIKVIFDDLRHAGVPEERIARIHAPIGVDIGAVTAEEIALSIAAELVSVRRAERVPPVTGPTMTPGPTP